MSSSNDDPLERDINAGIDRAHTAKMRELESAISRNRIDIAAIDRELARQDLADEMKHIVRELLSLSTGVREALWSASSLPTDKISGWCRSYDQIIIMEQGSGEKLETLIRQVRDYLQVLWVNPSMMTGPFAPSYKDARGHIDVMAIARDMGGEEFRRQKSEVDAILQALRKLKDYHSQVKGKL